MAIVPFAEAHVKRTQNFRLLDDISNAHFGSAVRQPAVLQ
jgi:hypothetical protein